MLRISGLVSLAFACLSSVAFADVGSAPARVREELPDTVVPTHYDLALHPIPDLSLSAAR